MKDSLIRLSVLQILSIIVDIVIQNWIYVLLKTANRA